MKRINGIRRLRQLAFALVPALMLGTLISAPVAAAAPVVLEVNIGGHCVRISSDLDDQVQLVWKDADGNLKVSKSLVLGGSFYYCNTHVRVEIGDTIKVKANAFTHVLVVEQVSIRVNRITDRLRGTAPADSLVHLRCSSSGPFPGFEPCVWRDLVRAASDGTWSVHPGFDILGDGTFHAFIKTNDGDKIWATGIAPFVTLTLGASHFDGAFRPNETALLTLSDPATMAVKASASDEGSPLDGAIHGRFRRPNGNGYQVVPGDAFTSNLSPDANWIVPNVEATAHPASDTVNGRCFDTGASADVAQIRLFRSGSQRGWAFVDTDADGFFTLDFPEVVFPDPTHIQSGDELLVSCMLAEGDWVQIWIVA
jgi:hypothetical protein